MFSIGSIHIFYHYMNSPELPGQRQSREMDGAPAGQPPTLP